MGRIVGRYLLGTLLIAALISGGLTWRIWQAGQPHTPGPADAIVVLGAAQYNGRPSAVFAARLDHAAHLFRNSLVAPAIVTVGGGQDSDSTTEADAGRQYLIDRGVPADAVSAIGMGTNTLSSLQAAADYFAEKQIQSIIIVTDPWHSARSRMMARDLGLIVQLSPVNSGPATENAIRTRYIWRELQATLFYRVTGGASGNGGPVI